MPGQAGDGAEKAERVGKVAEERGWRGWMMRLFFIEQNCPRSRCSGKGPNIWRRSEEEYFPSEAGGNMELMGW